MKRNTPSGAFTLVEILLVVCVIAILIGLTASATQAARQRAYTSAATTETEQLAAALKAYRIGDEEGKWPVDTGGDWKDATRDNLAGLLGGNGKPVLLAIDEARFEDDRYLDPWGNPYQFATNGGEDGEEGTIKDEEIVEALVSFPSQFARYYDWDDDVPYVNEEL